MKIRKNTRKNVARPERREPAKKRGEAKSRSKGPVVQASRDGFCTPAETARRFSFSKLLSAEGRSELLKAAPTESVSVPGKTVVPRLIPALEEKNADRLSAKHGIVLHRTASSTATSACNTFAQNKKGNRIGAHYVVDKDGTIYQTASLDKRLEHVGSVKPRCRDQGTCTPEELKKYNGLEGGKIRPSKGKKAVDAISDDEKRKAYPDRYPTNDDSVGIEIVGRYNKGGWEAPTPEQRESVAALVKSLQSRYGLSDQDVFPHSDIAWKTSGEGYGFGYGSTAPPPPSPKTSQPTSP